MVIGTSVLDVLLAVLEGPMVRSVAALSMQTMGTTQTGSGLDFTENRSQNYLNLPQTQSQARSSSTANVGMKTAAMSCNNFPKV